MSRVLLTGATGFVGAPTLAALRRRGYEVHAVARTPRDPQPEVTWHETDLLAPGSAEALCRSVGATHLVHLAWYAEPGRFWTAPENERWREVTAKLLSSFARTGGRHALMAGSCAEYRWEGRPLRELSSPLDPATLYGDCKLAAYQACSTIAKRDGLRLVWARLFFLYGPGESPGRLVPDVAVRLLRGERVATTAGTQKRDFMHVRDAANALAAMLDGSVRGPVNVCAGEAPSVRSVVEQIAEMAGAAGQLDLGALPMRPDDPDLILGDNSRLRREVGYLPTISLADGIRDTVAWWRDQLTQETLRQRSDPG